MKYLMTVAVAALTLALLQSENNAGDKAKHTIPEVMKTAMKGGLCKKVVSGKASDEEKKELAELFTSLSQNTPPKGDAKAWKERTTAMAAAAKKIAEGDAKAAKTLGGLTNCKTCHDAFKG